MLPRIRKKQMITKTDFGKFRNSWAGLPYIVSKGAQTNFIRFAEIVDDSWTKSEIQFNEKHFKDWFALRSFDDPIISQDESLVKGYFTARSAASARTPSGFFQPVA